MVGRGEDPLLKPLLWCGLSLACDGVKMEEIPRIGISDDYCKLGQINGHVFCSFRGLADATDVL